MGQKVHPTGIRLGIVKDHTSVWYADKKSYADYLLNDLEVRDFLRKRLADASVSRIDIERPAQTARQSGCMGLLLAGVVAFPTTDTRGHCRSAEPGRARHSAER